MGMAGTNGMDDRTVPVRCTRWTGVGRAWCVGDSRHESFVAGADDVPANRNLHFSLSSEQGLGRTGYQPYKLWLIFRIALRRVIHNTFCMNQFRLLLSGACCVVTFACFQVAARGASNP